jgi:hypothetical protein
MAGAKKAPLATASAAAQPCVGVAGCGCVNCAAKRAPMEDGGPHSWQHVPAVLLPTNTET